MAGITFENLSYRYPERQKDSLNHIHGSIQPGEAVLLTGLSGSGKSTLLRTIQGLVPNFYGGEIAGRVKVSSTVGMVFQDPEKQLVMTTVESEILFGMEAQGIPIHEMKRRLEEVLTYFNLHTERHRSVYHLSGGEKQKVALASVLALKPEILLLDEPTSQLDPVASTEILEWVRRLNQDFGMTVVMVEHRLEKCLDWVDQVWWMENGKVAFRGGAREFLTWCPISPYPIARLFQGEAITVKEGKRIMKGRAPRFIGREDNSIPLGSPVLECQQAWYARAEKDILKSITFSLHKGEILGVIGANGAGKSTLLRVVAGLEKPTRGSCKVHGQVGYLSQNPNDYLLQDTVKEELKWSQKWSGISSPELIEELLVQFGLVGMESVHPRDLSGGERQRVALASILVNRPDLLLLDEPTRGLDEALLQSMKEWMVEEKQKGTSMILISHDMEFVAKVADRVLLLSDGEVVGYGPIREILCGGLFYTTQCNRLFGGNFLIEEDIQWTEELACIGSGQQG